jgi:hypothetical protein
MTRMTHALSLLLSVAALAAAPAGSPAAGPRAPVAPAVVRAADPGADRPVASLVTADDVTRLCRALEPSERMHPEGDAVARGEAEAAHDAAHDAAVVGRYEVVVPGAGLAFAPYDGPERRLQLTEPVQLPFAEGTARLWPTEERGLAVEIDAAGARRVLDAQRTGALTLSVVFDLADDAACGTGARGKKFTLPVEPVSWRWLVDGAVLARGGAGVDRPLLTAAEGARPRVDVGDPISGPADAKKAVLARSTELEACYAEALKRDPGIDGVLVADLGGQRPAISADSVGDAELATCVARALGPLAPAHGGRTAVPIRFELEAPGAVRPAKAR